MNVKRSSFTEIRIVKAIKENLNKHEAKDISHEIGISTATFYNWQHRYGDMEVCENKKYIYS